MMPRAATLAIFISLLALIVGGLHYYLWLRLVRDTALPPPWRLVATITLVTLASCLPLSFLLSRLLPLSLTRTVLFPIYVWMGLSLILLTLLLGGDLLRLALWLIGQLRGGALLAEGSQRLLCRGLGLLALAGAIGATGLAVANGIGAPTIKRLTVPLPALPPALTGTTLVQLTDLHLGPTLGRAWLERIVSRVNGLDPDLVVITGDLVDGSVDRLRQETAPLGELRARHGVFFVTGNHEYYSGAVAWVAELHRLGLRVLRNERVTIAGARGGGFDLAGIDDLQGRGMAPGHGPDLTRALAGRDPRRPLVLLSHQPRIAEAAARAGVDLLLAGHTHGGQFWPWMHLVRLREPYVSGLHRLERLLLYVSDGTGFWGPPMRLGTRAEIVQITLVSAD